MVTMGHIQSSYVHAGIGQFLEHLYRFGGGANGADYFGFAHIISRSVAIKCKGISQLC